MPISKTIKLLTAKSKKTTKHTRVSISCIDGSRYQVSRHSHILNDGVETAIYCGMELVQNCTLPNCNYTIHTPITPDYGCCLKDVTEGGNGFNEMGFTIIRKQICIECGRRVIS